MVSRCRHYGNPHSPLRRTGNPDPAPTLARRIYLPNRKYLLPLERTRHLRTLGCKNPNAKRTNPLPPTHSTTGCIRRMGLGPLRPGNELRHSLPHLTTMGHLLLSLRTHRQPLQRCNSTQNNSWRIRHRARPASRVCHTTILLHFPLPTDNAKRIPRTTPAICRHLRDDTRPDPTLQRKPCIRYRPLSKRTRCLPHSHSAPIHWNAQTKLDKAFRPMGNARHTRQYHPQSSPYPNGNSQRNHSLAPQHRLTIQHNFTPQRIRHIQAILH